MKKSFFWRVAAVAVVFFAFVGSNAFGGTKNVEFASVNFYGKLKENNTLSVVQNLEVNFSEPAAEFVFPVPSEIRYRDKDDVERKYVLRIDEVSVKDFAFSSEKTSAFKLKISGGDSDFSGKRKFTVSYDVLFPEDRLNEYDFFYYILLDSEIGGTVKKFDFKIDFEKKIENLSEVSVFSGEKGEKSNRLNVDVSFSKSGIAGSALNIKEGNAVSVFMNLPEGYFVGSRSNFHLNVFAYISFVFTCALSIFFIVLILLIKNEKLDAVPSDYPPEEISSAEVGFIIDSSADIDDIISLIPYWESKNIVKIEERDEGGAKKVVIKKNADLPENAPAHERKFFNAVFADSIEFDLSSDGEKLSKGIRASQSSLKSSFKGEKALFKDKGTIPFCCAACLALSVFLKFNSRVEFFGGFGYFSGPVMFLCGMLVALGKKRILFKKNAFLYSTLITLAAAAALYAFTCFFTNESDIVISKPVAAVPFALVALLDLLISRLRQPTDYNRSVSAKLLGLKSFIAGAASGDEKIKENAASDSGYFKKILPYAFVFGLSEKWAAAFDNSDEGNTEASDYLKFFQSKVCDPIYKSYSKIYSRK